MEPVNSKKNKQIKPVLIEKELKDSFLDYAMSVVVSRAIPDVRDGLKPVHQSCTVHYEPTWFSL